MASFSPCPLCQQKDFQTLFRQRRPSRRRVVRCLNDGLVMVNPQPAKKQIDALYDSKYFQEFDPYLKSRQVHLSYFRRKLEQIEKKLGRWGRPSRRPGKLLDVGCGLGFLLNEAQRRGWETVGIDVSNYPLKFCRQLGLTVKKGTLKTAKLPAASFDVVTSLQTIEHETNPLEHTQAIYRLLKPGGLAVITTPNHDSWTRKLMGSGWFGYRHKEHLFFLSPSTLKALLRRAGFGKIEIQRDQPRVFTLGYYLTRLNDFYPRPLVRLFASLLKKIAGGLPIPTDPWGDIIAFAQK